MHRTTERRAVSLLVQLLARPNTQVDPRAKGEYRSFYYKGTHTENGARCLQRSMMWLRQMARVVHHRRLHTTGVRKQPPEQAEDGKHAGRHACRIPREHPVEVCPSAAPLPKLTPWFMTSQWAKTAAAGAAGNSDGGGSGRSLSEEQRVPTPSPEGNGVPLLDLEPLRLVGLLLGRRQSNLHIPVRHLPCRAAPASRRNAS